MSREPDKPGQSNKTPEKVEEGNQLYLYYVLHRLYTLTHTHTHTQQCAPLDSLHCAGGAKPASLTFAGNSETHSEFLYKSLFSVSITQAT